MRAYIDPSECDQALRWLMASDRVVADQAARALIDVKQARLHVKEGHARWSAYLRAFVPLTPRWCQHEMRRERSLADYPMLAAAYREGRIGKSRLRAILRVVTTQTEAVWCRRGETMTVRRLEEVAAQERQGGLDGARPSGSGDLGDVAPLRRVVMAPAGVARLVAEAVEVARKLDGYHIGTGQAVAMMALETMAGLPHVGDPPAGVSGEDAAPRPGGETQAELPPEDVCLLDDGDELRRELPGDWRRLHRQLEAITACWADLTWDLPDVRVDAPAADASPHERVVFWTRIMARLDALRGRLLRLVDDCGHADNLGFAGLGHYARERMGLSAREARDLVRLDRALSDLPVAFRMYAAGRLGRRAAWLVRRVANPATERSWTRFALTHSHRLMRAAVEAAQLRRQVDPVGWRRTGGLPPSETTFAELLRTCSHLRDVDPPTHPSARVQIYFDAAQQACFDQAAAQLRDLYGRDRPDWWCLAVMAQHFMDCYARLEDESVPARLRRMIHRKVIRRDNFTCAAPECLQRGGLEADHIRLRSRGGPDAMANMTTLCVAHHRYLKHQAGSLELCGTAPGGLTIRMGGRLYRNDRLVSPAIDERELDEEPWKLKDDPASRGEGKSPHAAPFNAAEGRRRKCSRRESTRRSSSPSRRDRAR